MPLAGSIRVSLENRCIALVDRQDGGSRDGKMAVYVGPDLHGGRRADPSTGGGGPDLSLLEAGGYAVLDFAREGGMLVLDRVAECGSLSLEKRDGRDVAVFKVRAAGFLKGECPECGNDAEIIPEGL